MFLLYLFLLALKGYFYRLEIIFMQYSSFGYVITIIMLGNDYNHKTITGSYNRIKR